MKKINKSLVLAMGTTLIAGLTSTVNAETVATQGNAFEMTELSNGYMQLAAADTATTSTTAKAKAKTMEGKCAGAQPMSAPKAAEGKCGEGKCGGTMKAAEPAKATTSAGQPASSATTKATEGKCGEGKCGAAMKKAASGSAKAANTSATKK
jgi:uncharacterized low-complexity protein